MNDAEWLRLFNIVKWKFQGVEVSTDWLQARFPGLLAFGTKACKSLPGREAADIGKLEFMEIGILEPKKNKSGESFYNLKISIPFQKEEGFYVFVNKQKKSEKSADLVVFNNGSIIGFIWKRKSNDGTRDFLSGFINIITYERNDNNTLVAAKGILSFSVFKNERINQDTGEVLKTENVVVLNEGKKDSSKNNSTNSDDPDDVPW